VTYEAEEMKFKVSWQFQEIRLSQDCVSCHERMSFFCLFVLSVETPPQQRKHYFLFVGAFLSGGNVMDRGTVETALMSPLPVRTDTALLVSSSVTMGTAQVHISYVIPSQIAMTDQMKILYFAVRYQ